MLTVLQELSQLDLGVYFGLVAGWEEGGRRVGKR